MSNQTTARPCWISISQAAQISKDAGINAGKGISISTIHRWVKRGQNPNGFPIVTHRYIPTQIDKKCWVDLIEESANATN